MKKRTKKSSGSLIKRKTLEILVKDLAILQLNTNGLELVDLKNMQVNRKGGNYSIKNTLMHERHRWSVLLVMFCTESNSKKKMVTEQINFGSANHYKFLCDSLTDSHRSMIKKYDDMLTIESLGFLAVPVYKFDFDEIAASIDNLFVSEGCYRDTIQKII